NAIVRRRALPRIPARRDSRGRSRCRDLRRPARSRLAPKRTRSLVRPPATRICLPAWLTPPISEKANARHLAARSTVRSASFARLRSIDGEHAVYSRLELMAVRLEFFTGRLERAAARRILVAEAARFARLLGICGRSIRRAGCSH